MSSSTSPPRVELYVQALDPSRNRQIGDLLDRIEELEAAGKIASWDVYIVGETMCPDTAFETEVGRHLCARFLQFRDWARRTERQLDPFFYPQTVRSDITGEEHEAITVPTVTLAEFADESLRFVSPCMDTDAYHTPRERLKAISSGEFSDAEETPPQL